MLRGHVLNTNYAFLNQRSFSHLNRLLVSQSMLQNQGQIQLQVPFLLYEVINGLFCNVDCTVLHTIIKETKSKTCSLYCLIKLSTMYQIRLMVWDIMLHEHVILELYA